MRKPRVGMTVQYFHRGEPNSKPSAGLVCGVGRDVVQLFVFNAEGTQTYRGCVRHVSDPYLEANPEVRTAEGAYRFVDEEVDPPEPKPKQQQQPAKQQPSGKQPQAASA